MAESKSSFVLHHRLICLLGDHRRRPAVLGVDIVIEVADHRRPLLLGLLMEIGHCNTSSEDGIVGMRDSHARRGLGSLYSGTRR